MTLKVMKPLSQLELAMLGAQAGGPGNIVVLMSHHAKPREWELHAVKIAPDGDQWEALLARVKEGKSLVYGVRPIQIV